MILYKDLKKFCDEKAHMTAESEEEYLLSLKFLILQQAAIISAYELCMSKNCSPFIQELFEKTKTTYVTKAEKKQNRYLEEKNEQN